MISTADNYVEKSPLALALAGTSNPHSLSAHFRRRRSKQLRSMIETVYLKNGSVRILDLGGRSAYWEGIFDRGWLGLRKVSITLLNLPGEAGPTEPGDPIFTSIEGDAIELGTAFDCDIAHSNSVIEHVGGWKQMEAFAGVLRAAPHYYVQTPYFWFPVDPHSMMPVLHWLPLSLQAKIRMRFSLPNFPRAQEMWWAMRDIDTVRMLDRSQVRALFPDADLSFEWFGLPKSIIAAKG